MSKSHPETELQHENVRRSVHKLIHPGCAQMSWKCTVANPLVSMTRVVCIHLALASIAVVASGSIACVGGDSEEMRVQVEVLQTQIGAQSSMLTATATVRTPEAAPTAVSISPTPSSDDSDCGNHRSAANANIGGARTTHHIDTFATHHVGTVTISDADMPGSLGEKAL